MSADRFCRIADRHGRRVLVEVRHVGDCDRDRDITLELAPGRAPRAVRVGQPGDRGADGGAPIPADRDVVHLAASYVRAALEAEGTRA